MGNGLQFGALNQITFNGVVNMNHFEIFLSASDHAYAFY